MENRIMSRHSGRWIVWFGVFVILATWILAAWVAYGNRQHELLRAEEETGNLAIILEGHIRETFLRIETSLIALRMQDESGATKEEVHQLLRSVVASSPGLFNLISILDAEGNVVVTDQKSFKPTYSGDRPFFLYHKENPSMGLRIGHPILGRVTKKWYIPASLRLQDSSGRFKGVILASVNPLYFSMALREVVIGKNSLVYLAGFDGVIYTGFIGKKDLGLGKKIPKDRLDQFIGGYRRSSFVGEDFDGVKRIQVIDFVDGRSMFVVVGVSLKEYLRPMYEKMVYDAGMLLVYSIFLMMFIVRLQKATQMREAVEKDLRESEARNRSILDHSSDLIWNLSPQGVFTYASPSWKTVTGHAVEEITGAPFQPLVHEEDVAACMTYLAGLIGSRQSAPSPEYRVRHADGTWHWHQGVGNPVLDADGRVRSVIGVSRDITERKLAEEALRESEEKLSALFGAMTEMVVLHELVLDDAGKPVNYRILDCNAAFTRVTGIRREEAVGKLGDEVYGTPEPPFLEEYARVGTTGEPAHHETWSAPLDRHFSVSVVSPGKNRFATITADTTETKRIEGIIAAKNKELEQLVYVASHDLRSPLVNVDGYSRELEYSLQDLTALLDGGKDRNELETALRAEFPDMRQSIARIRASTTQMDRLLKGLLQLSRMGRVALQVQDVDMNGCLAQLAASFAFALGEIGGELTVEDLPPCRGDAVQVTQVFSNLIDNAIKYRAPEHPLGIRVSGTLEADRAVYRVRDNGIGIAENHLEHVFELFHRLEPGKTAGEGLGLTIARQSLSRMHGEIRVESEPGAGSLFVVSLPTARRGADKS